MNVKRREQTLGPIRRVMLKARRLPIPLIAMVSLSLPGCVNVKDEDLPSIAHVHIGHALTNWAETPEQEGLYLVAVDEATQAHVHAVRAAREGITLAELQREVGHAMYAIDPAYGTAGSSLGFGAKQALLEAGDHLVFAANSKDASDNVRQFVIGFSRASDLIVERFDLMIALGEEIEQAPSLREAHLMTGELTRLARETIDGVDLDGDGMRGLLSEELGLVQLKERLFDMAEREEPPYQPVPKRYLFGLIRLADGEWVWAWDQRAAGERRRDRY